MFIHGEDSLIPARESGSDPGRRSIRREMEDGFVEAGMGQ